ncbi:MAG: response regulator [Halobacteriovoraceae bacterium]|nr:response regulator [Halobacteriovoraceae bacterium]|tara:strand:- start:3539 stop:3907 length:369 start_codon:yes stop_codon:yes gene_type:complete
MKILIIDDSNSIAMMVGQFIKELGHDSYHATDGRDAIDMIAQEDNFDLILLDWNMPEMDGLEFLKYNQENSLTKTPIMMMTTENKPEKIMKALEFGAVEYIMKPFSKDVLESKISTLKSMAA